MKDNINYYYNFNLSEVENWGSIYRFKINQDFFYFVPLKRAEAELNDIINVSKELKTRGIEVHDIILNRYGKIVTNIYNENYILLKLMGNNFTEFDLPSIIKMNQSLILTPEKSKLYHNNWGKLWSNKIDYFEYQVHELGKNKTLILDSFSYYIGLGENAIAYANVINSKYQPTFNDRIVLSHKRIHFPNYKLNFLNPLSFIFDLEVRDIAEYLKSSFLAGEDTIHDLKEVLRLKTFPIYSLGMLYARLLYPTYYFDIYEKIMNKTEEEDALVPIVEKASDYEKFLKQAYFEIVKYAPIDRIDWILNEKK